MFYRSRASRCGIEPRRSGSDPNQAGCVVWCATAGAAAAGTLQLRDAGRCADSLAAAPAADSPQTVHILEEGTLQHARQARETSAPAIQCRAGRFGHTARTCQSTPGSAQTLAVGRPVPVRPPLHRPQPQLRRDPPAADSPLPLGQAVPLPARAAARARRQRRCRLLPVRRRPLLPHPLLPARFLCLCCRRQAEALVLCLFRHPPPVNQQLPLDPQPC